MPRVSSRQATQEEYEEWLGRLEEEEPLPDQWDLFQATLKGELYGFNDTQIEKLWELKGVEADYAEHGIRSLIVKYPWGSEIRYGIQGMSGLWGFDTIQELRSGEDW
jgi:hypothetical protein